MRNFLKFIMRPLVKKLYPLVMELADEEFERSGVNARNQLAFMRLSATLPNSILLMKGACIINKQNNPAKITFGENCRLGSNAELMIFKYGGEIKIGENTLINSGCRLHSMKKITIGNGVLLSYNVMVFDTNSHPLDPLKRRRHWTDEEIDKEVGCTEVVIEDDAWIGANATILKGVTIGHGSIVAANSVVTGNVEPMVIVAGNPAKKIKQITNDR